MKTLAIVCFYDKEGIADAYFINLLQELKIVSDELIVVINGTINSVGLVQIKDYASEVIVRTNDGMDIGAYSDVIRNHLGKMQLETWDRIILCNDTFYGPFEKMDTIIEQMEYKNCDFWGLNYFEASFLSHIQSYFLVFNQRVIRSGDLYNFFENEISISIEEYEDACVIFEVGLFYYLCKKGYQYATYSNTHNYDISENPDYAIKKCGLPILKKKSFDRNNYNQKKLDDVLKYIEENYSYDINLIVHNAKRVYQIDLWEGNKIGNEEWCSTLPWPVMSSTEEDIVNFLKKNDKVYIYGAGMYGRKIWYLFQSYIKDFQGFVVTDGKYKRQKLYGYPILSHEEIGADSAVVVALNKENSEAVSGFLKDVRCVHYLW